MRVRFVSLAAVLAALGIAAPSAGATTYSVTSSGDGADGDLVDNVCDTSGAGIECTLRAAIQTVNAGAGAGPHTISLSSLTGATINVGADFDAVTAAGTIFEGCSTPTPSPTGPCVGLRASTAGQGTGLDIEAADVIVRGLAISRFDIGVNVSGVGMRLHNSDLGIRVDHTTIEGMDRGVLITGSGARIGGPGSADGNAFAGNGDGLAIWGGDSTAVTGNLFGQRRDGFVAGNDRGVAVTGVAFFPGPASNEASGNVIGGTSNAADEDGFCAGNCNVFAGIPGDAGGAGVDLGGAGFAAGEAPAASVTVAGNWIGLDRDGDDASDGVGIKVGDGGQLAAGDTAGAMIGGPTPSHGNLISGNTIGLDQTDGQGVLTVMLNQFGFGRDLESPVPNTTTNAKLGGDYQQRDALAVGNRFGATASGLVLTGPQPCLSSNFFTPDVGTYTQAAVVIEAGAPDARIGNELGCAAGFAPGNYFGRTAPGAPAILVRGADDFKIVSNVVGMIPFAAPLAGPAVRIVDGQPGDNPSTGGRIGSDNPNLWNAFTRLSGPAVEIGGHATGIVIAGGEGIAVNDFASPSSLWTDLLSIPALGNAPTGQNGGIQPPTIGASTTAAIAGTGIPGAAIRLLQRGRADSPTDGIDEPIPEGYTIPTMGATTTVAPDGNWSLVYAEKLPEGQGVTASQTTADGSSEFAALKTATPAPPLPVAQITGGPSGTTTERTATFSFSTPTPGATLECALDGGAFAPCTSPITFGPLDAGAHQFQVQARVLSTVSLPVSRTWAIDSVRTPAAPSSPPSSSAAANARSFNALVSMPSTRRCVSRRKLRLRLRKAPAGTKIVFAEIRVTGRPLRTVSGRRLTAAIDLRGLPKGKVRVRVRVVLSSGRVVSGSRTYKTCAPKKAKKKATKKKKVTRR